jgi:hypothetical protein
MNNWKSPEPKENWSDREQTNFLREIWQRLRFFYVTVPLGFSVPAGGVTPILVTVPGGGGDIETELVRGLRDGMPIKLTYTTNGIIPPNAGMTWDCAVMSDDVLSMWWMNSSAGVIAIQEGDWAVMGIIT